VKEKLGCTNLLPKKAKGALLLELAHEMKELKEEVEDRKYRKPNSNHVKRPIY
jgi:hypothetical protein